MQNVKNTEIVFYRRLGLSAALVAGLINERFGKGINGERGRGEASTKLTVARCLITCGVSAGSKGGGSIA
jgi:hypothetical protein